MLFVSYMRHSAEFFYFKLRRDHRKKIPMSAAPMSRLTKRAFLRLSYERRAYESVDEKSLS